MDNSFLQYIENGKYRHVLGISGGKDSSALAIYIKERYPQVHEKMEYFFSDTGAELKEVYEFLDKLEAFLGKEIVRLNSGKSFDDWLNQQNQYLPSPRQRWCTQLMKIKPFEAFIGDDPVVSYIGIRADENREGYISKKDTIKPVFPFIEDGLVKEDIFNFLENTVGIPEYYKWRSRSGCYFCFFQQQKEWLGLKRNHPELFEKARQYELQTRTKYDWKEGEIDVGGHGYTWSSSGTIDQAVERAERAELREKEKQEKGIKIDDKRNVRWQDTLKNEDDDPDNQSCLICSL